MQSKGYRGSAAIGFMLLVAAVPAGADCPPADDRIADIAGPEPVASVGDSVRVRGVITGDYRGDDALRGFFLQQSAADDGAPPRGTFVFTPDRPPDAGGYGPGAEVVVAGEVSEHREQRQIGWVDAITVCDRPGLPEPADLPFPSAERDAWEALAGVKVRVTEPLTVTGNYELVRYGTLDLAARGRLYQPTQLADYDGADHDARRLTLDDGRYVTYPETVPFLDAEGTRRVGSVIPELTGVLTHAFDDWRIHPLATDQVEWISANPRPDPPGRPPGGVRIVGFNVEDYFLTLGDRGAQTQAELTRQREQLEAVATGLRPDLFGIVEVENEPAAVADLAQRLGEAAGVAGGYAHFNVDAPVGTDRIRVALAWDPERVEPVAGPFFDDDPVHHRPPIAAHFRFGDDGPGKLVAVVHHKAKRGCPDEGDVDRGQGCWNERRTEQSQALAQFLARKREETGTERVLIIGDINSYAREDPVELLAQAGYGDLLRRLPPAARSTYVFRGMSGNLDVALASEALADSVEGVAVWDINADEPAELHEIRPVAGPWRSSDHDPVIVDVATPD